MRSESDCDKREPKLIFASSDVFQGCWAVADSSHLIPAIGACHRLLHDPEILKRLQEPGLIGRLYLVGAME
jgi:hypothetical protein